MSPNAHWLISNEFSAMVVELDNSGRSARLRLTHRVSGQDICLDALQLEALLKLEAADIWRLLDPSRLGEPEPELHADG